jgi:hypothetical protein
MRSMAFPVEPATEGKVAGPAILISLILHLASALLVEQAAAFAALI